jgi:hypothetical protein
MCALPPTAALFNYVLDQDDSIWYWSQESPLIFLCIPGLLGAIGCDWVGGQSVVQFYLACHPADKIPAPQATYYYR